MLGLTFSRKPITVILMVSGSIFLTIASVSLVYSWNFVRVASNAKGKIIRIIESEDKDGKIYYPVFSFQDAQGTEHTIQSSWGSFPSAYTIGDTVPVLYDSNHPGGAKIYSFLSIWGVALITGILGLFDLSAGLITWFWPSIVQRFKKTDNIVTC